MTWPLRNLEAQLRTITRAHARGDTDEIDPALLHVNSIRHMKKQGILELLDDVDRPAKPD
ncbi:MAG: hypothetical protein AAF999_04715 [Pseudomonadota bacterium]